MEDALGITGPITVMASFAMVVWNKIGIKEINEYVVFVTAILGLVFMVYKIILTRLEIKSKKREQE